MGGDTQLHCPLQQTRLPSPDTRHRCCEQRPFLYGWRHAVALSAPANTTSFTGYAAPLLRATPLLVWVETRSCIVRSSKHDFLHRIRGTVAASNAPSCMGGDTQLHCPLQQTRLP